MTRTYTFEGYENSVYYCSADSLREAWQTLKAQVKDMSAWRFESSEKE